MLSPYQQLQKKMTDSERDAFLLKKTLELIEIHNKILGKISEIEKIKAAPSVTPGPRGFKGDPGKTYSQEEIVEIIKPYIPRVENGKTPTKQELVSIISELMPRVDVDQIAKVAAVIVKQKLPKSQVIDINELLKGKKFQINDIEGLKEAIDSAKRYSQPYLHGGGVPSLSAGVGITLTPKNDGGFTVSSTGAGTWYEDETLARTDGTNYTLAHAPTTIVLLFLNGKKLNGGGDDYTRVGTAISMTTPTLSSDVLTATYS